MKSFKILFSLLFCFSIFNTSAQVDPQIIDQILDEANNHSQLEPLAMELMDDIGPRLIGTPQMQKANEWVVNSYHKWGIDAWNEQYGTWRGWERGRTTVQLLSPLNKPLDGIQLAWCPATKKPITAEVIMLPMFKDSAAFVQWLPQVKGKIVMISKPEISGRPDENWKSNALPEEYEAFLKRKKEANEAWNNNLKIIGTNLRLLPQLMENAGAVAVLSTYWTGAWSAQRIFGAKTTNIPNVNLSLEDYTLLARYISRGKKPEVMLSTTSKDLGMQPAMNSIGMMQGHERGKEIVFLSAHLDSWDGATGATDNGTGTVLMMEVMRILKKVYPNPRRTIMVGHWASEEQGLNGSGAFVEDHPEMMERISVLFNQDNGTGRFNWINGNGFIDAYDYFRRWMAYLPATSRDEIKTDFPGSPGSRGGSDYASFLAAGVPAFFLISNSWNYGDYTWHTQLDTYDKIVFEEMRRNAATLAILVYLACEEPEMMSRNKALLPMDVKTGKRADWIPATKPERKGESR